MKQELRLSGTGGQGLITAGIILAEAAPPKQRSLSLTKRSTSRK